MTDQYKVHEALPVLVMDEIGFSAILGTVNASKGVESLYFP
jgi:hypothetical protein